MTTVQTQPLTVQTQPLVGATFPGVNPHNEPDKEKWVDENWEDVCHAFEAWPNILPKESWEILKKGLNPCEEEDCTNDESRPMIKPEMPFNLPGKQAIQCRLRRPPENFEEMPKCLIANAKAAPFKCGELLHLSVRIKSEEKYIRVCVIFKMIEIVENTGKPTKRAKLSVEP